MSCKAFHGNVLAVDNVAIQYISIFDTKPELLLCYTVDWVNAFFVLN